jgi:hypothetical protein
VDGGGGGAEAGGVERRRGIGVAGRRCRSEHAEGPQKRARCRSDG